jgi:hypothetical protein
MLIFLIERTGNIKKIEIILENVAMHMYSIYYEVFTIFFILM